MKLSPVTAWTLDSPWTAGAFSALRSACFGLHRAHPADGGCPQAYQQGFKGNCWCYEACSVKHCPGLALLRAALTFTLEKFDKIGAPG